MINPNICTTDDLKSFAWSFINTSPKYFDFVQWLKSKTDNKYTIIDVEFLMDALRALEQIALESNKHAMLSADLNDEFKKKWAEFIKML